MRLDRRLRASPKSPRPGLRSLEFRRACREVSLHGTRAWELERRVRRRRPVRASLRRGSARLRWCGLLDRQRRSRKKRRRLAENVPRLERGRAWASVRRFHKNARGRESSRLHRCPRRRLSSLRQSRRLHPRSSHLRNAPNSKDCSFFQ